MDLLTYIKKISPQKIAQIKSLHHLDKDEPVELYSQLCSILEKNLSLILSTLSSQACYVFFKALIKPALEVENLDAFPVAELYEALEELEKKTLASFSKSVQKLRPLTKVTIFDEIVEILGKKFPTYGLEQVLKKMRFLTKSSINLKCVDMPFDMLHFFYCFGLVCKKDFLEQQFSQSALSYFIDDQTIREAMIFCNLDGVYQFIPCYELNAEKLEPSTPNIVRSIGYNTVIFNSIIKLIYCITKDDILITKKGEVNKKHYDRLAKEIPSENVLWFLIQFFTKHHFVENHPKNNYIQMTERGYAFFQQDISEVYQKIIKTDVMLEEIYQILEKMGKNEFAVADVVLAYLKDHLIKEPQVYFYRETRRLVIKYLEILSYTGLLVQKFSAEGFTYYSFNPRYKNLSNEERSPNQPIYLSPAMEITVYPQELDLQTSYLLNIFCDLERMSDLFIYKVSANTIRRAIYFGFEIETFLDMLQVKSRNPIPENFKSNIERWKEQFKKGDIKEVQLLITSKESLDILCCHHEYASLIKERLNDTHAIVSREIYSQRILEDVAIYLYT